MVSVLLSLREHLNSLTALIQKHFLSKTIFSERGENSTIANTENVTSSYNNSSPSIILTTAESVLTTIKENGTEEINVTTVTSESKVPSENVTIVNNVTTENNVTAVTESSVSSENVTTSTNVTTTYNVTTESVTTPSKAGSLQSSMKYVFCFLLLHQIVNKLFK